MLFHSPNLHALCPSVERVLFPRSQVPNLRSQPRKIGSWVSPSDRKEDSATLFLWIPRPFINLYEKLDFWNVHYFSGYPASIVPPFGDQTPNSLGNHAPSSHPNGLTSPVSGGFRPSGLSFSWQLWLVQGWACDTFRANEVQADCSYGFWDCGRHFSIGLSLSCSYDGRCSLRLNPRGKGQETWFRTWRHHLSLWIQLCLKMTTTSCTM